MPRVVTLQETVRGGLTVYAVPGLGDLGVDAFFTARPGGVSTGPYGTLNLGLHVGDDESAVRENRRRVENALGSPVRYLRQVHGAEIINGVDDPIVEADGIHLRGTDAGAIMVADCIPVLAYSPTTGSLVLAHAGWKGLVSGMLERVCSVITTSHDDTVVVLGPAISAERYQVGRDVVTAHEAFARHAVVDDEDRFRLDLRGAAADVAERAGVRAENVWITDAVTGDDTPFFSDRAHRPCGRFALIARRS